jgi:hypothetical protein
VKEDDYYWDRIKHEENLFTSRLNVFLFAESILFAILAVILDEPDRHGWHLVCVSFLGLVISGMWYYVCRRQWQHSWGPAQKLIEGLEKNHPTEDEYQTARWHAKVRKESPFSEDRRVRSADVLGYWLPTILVIMWFAVLVFAFVGRFQLRG